MLEGVAVPIHPRVVPSDTESTRTYRDNLQNDKTTKKNGVDHNVKSDGRYNRNCMY